MKGAMKIIDKYTLMMACETCGKKHAPTLEDGRIPKESYYCSGCRDPEESLKQNVYRHRYSP